MPKHNFLEDISGRELLEASDDDFIKAVKTITQSIVMGNHQLGAMNKTLVMLLTDMTKRMDVLGQALVESSKYRLKKMKLEIARDEDGQIVTIDTIEYE